MVLVGANVKLKRFIFSLFLFCVILAGCHPAPGPKVDIINGTHQEITVYIDLAPNALVDSSGVLTDTFTDYDGTITTFDPFEHREMILSSAAFLSLETLYIITAVATIDESIVFQRIFSGADFEDPETVIVVTN